jgi:hypothetical protein
MPFYPLKVLQVKERAPIFCSFVVFTSNSHLSLSRSLGVHHKDWFKKLQPTNWNEMKIGMQQKFRDVDLDEIRMKIDIMK